MMEITTSNSIKVKPRCRQLMVYTLILQRFGWTFLHERPTNDYFFAPG